MGYLVTTLPPLYYMAYLPWWCPGFCPNPPTHLPPKRLFIVTSLWSCTQLTLSIWGWTLALWPSAAWFLFCSFYPRPNINRLLPWPELQKDGILGSRIPQNCGGRSKSSYWPKKSLFHPIARGGSGRQLGYTVWAVPALGKPICSINLLKNLVTVT